MVISVDNMGNFPFSRGFDKRLVVDNLRNVEIVLASGECVQANETDNPDLFWAVRGPS
jgi:hypothetical protein